MTSFIFSRSQPLLQSLHKMSPFTLPWLLINTFLILHSIHHLRAVSPAIPTCSDRCGNLTLKFPFGSGFGCGHPKFARYIKCSYGTLQLSTVTGTYTISSIDYSTTSLIVTDSLMSTCASMQNSGSFRLDRNSPFTLTSENIFVLLGCSTTSPVYDPKEDLCDKGSGLHLCRGLYSCDGVAGIGLEPNAPISSCCVYQPTIVLGPDYGLDLPKLQCSSYASMYGFGGNEGDPMKWQFGISMVYNDTYNSESCNNCEASGGLCGFAGLGDSFSCICRNGVNTTANCFGRGYAWSRGWKSRMGTKIFVGGILLAWLVFL